MDSKKKKKVLSWCSPSCGVLKVNVEGAVKGKPGLAGIEGILRNQEGKVLYLFSKHVWIKDSNEAEVPAILELISSLSYCGE